MPSVFDYSGYSEEKLLALCDSKKVFHGLAPWRYGTAEVYSAGRYLRNYGYYPSWLPLYCYSSHGFNARKDIPPHELDNDAYAHLEMSYFRYQEFQKIGKHSFCVLAPFVWCRRKHGITKAKSASGLLAFPAHSTPNVSVVSSILEYIDVLKELRNLYSPICICLFMSDVLSGQYKIFMEHGFPVYTAGHNQDVRFAKRWYDIVKNFSFTTSDLIGSYTMYSFEMGIPFFAYGQEPSFYNKSDVNAEIGNYTSWKCEEYIAAYNLFNKHPAIITREQKQYAEKSLGVQNTISRFELAKVLYKSFLKKRRLKDLLWLPTTPLRILRKSTHKFRHSFFKKKI